MKDKKANVEKKVKYEIPVKGSLGLLAMGDKGLRAWRKVRDDSSNNKKK